MKGSQTTHFMATINSSNAAFLDGHVEEATELILRPMLALPQVLAECLCLHLL